MRIKKAATLGLISTVVLIPSVHAAFSDVTEKNPHYEAIEYVRNEGIVDGYSDNTYRPQDFINRAEFTKIIVAAHFSEQEITTCLDKNSHQITFPDTPHNSWFTPYVCVAKIHGLIDGYPDRTFKPSNRIEFAESAKILANAFNLAVQPHEQVWYKSYVEALGKKNAIPVSIFTFDSDLTRGEMAEMLWRLKAPVTSKESLLFGDLQKAVENARIAVEANENLQMYHSHAYNLQSEDPYLRHFSFWTNDYSSDALQSGTKDYSYGKKYDSSQFTKSQSQVEVNNKDQSTKIRFLVNKNEGIIEYNDQSDTAKVFYRGSELPAASVICEYMCEVNLAISPNGVHFAYVAVDGNKKFLVVDGNKLSQKNYAWIGRISITNAGKLLYQVSQKTSDSWWNAPLNHQVIVDDAQYDCDYSRFILSKNTEHYAIYCTSKEGKRLILDGAKYHLEDYTFEDAQLSNTGLLVHGGQTPLGKDASLPLIVVGGEIMRGMRLETIVTDDTGDTIWYAFVRNNKLYVENTNDYKEVFVRDLSETETSRGNSADISILKPIPDGKGFFLNIFDRKEYPNPHNALYINQRRLPIYDEYSTVVFTPDGKYMIYVVRDGNAYERLVERVK